ncbi:MAG: SMC family ATPase, partial [Candidatus Korarchaeota archaeon]|nr:SMC family ATPase [Candidatus Korarchaeota archaeon]NIU83999.1 SMC family ATPase [Candidatus Thorarchaeota archaeon]NIW13061.1 SMC family ATPase [Candidatus Thorarchaeota archaeon]NIW52243.1 SMC family ATPase [Candidatus Korarchaeota archaeon]
RTEKNMARFLPILTAGRYKDAKIDPDSYTIRVYDSRAQTYKDKKIFSGGTKDQVSLALRLSFAMATLPQERGTAPDFLFLDEPVGSFDDERQEALVELLTRGEIAETFNQIFVVSHVGELKEEFSRYIKMEDGQIVDKAL